MAEIERDGGQAVALGADVADPGAADELFESARVALRRAGAGARQQRRHQPRRPHPVARTTTSGTAVIETDLTAAFRLTRRALKSMIRARVGPDRQHLLGRRAAREPRAGQLRGREGRPDRADQDRGGRGGAARGDDQRGRAGMDRHRDDGGVFEGPARGGSGAARRHARGGRRVRALSVSEEASYVTGAVLTRRRRTGRLGG